MQRYARFQTVLNVHCLCPSSIRSHWRRTTAPRPEQTSAQDAMKVSFELDLAAVSLRSLLARV